MQIWLCTQGFSNHYEDYDREMITQNLETDRSEGLLLIWPGLRTLPGELKEARPKLIRFWAKEYL